MPGRAPPAGRGVRAHAPLAPAPVVVAAIAAFADATAVLAAARPDVGGPPLKRGAIAPNFTAAADGGNGSDGDAVGDTDSTGVPAGERLVAALRPRAATVADLARGPRAAFSAATRPAVLGGTRQARRGGGRSAAEICDAGRGGSGGVGSTYARAPCGGERPEVGVGCYHLRAERLRRVG
ncbi:hypothetical protein MMPV_004275 [Pyropia vietnamensis]